MPETIDTSTHVATITRILPDYGNYWRYEELTPDGGVWNRSELPAAPDTTPEELIHVARARYPGNHARVTVVREPQARS